MKNQANSDTDGIDLEFWATATEAQMRDAEAPTPDTPEELAKLTEVLAGRSHDYGTCAYAMSVSATAAFNMIARILGVTGFQASCADLDILKRTRRLKRFRIVDLSQLLFPQYKDHFRDVEAELKEAAGWVGDDARAKLEECMSSTGSKHHPGVMAHWVELSGRFPHIETPVGDEG